MTDEFKIYWRLYKELYSNEEVLRSFTNLMDLYHPLEDGCIIDIGCGQSPYLIDFYKYNKHKLFAVDIEEEQIEMLKQRISQIESEVEISYSTKEFPSTDFRNERFSGVILSNFLHFMSLTESKLFLEKIIPYALPRSIFVVTVHSWKHQFKDDKSYFKHYFTKADFYKIFPSKYFDYLYFDQVSADKTESQKQFAMSWIKEVYISKGYVESEVISNAQTEYLLKSARMESITCVLRMK